MEKIGDFKWYGRVSDEQWAAIKKKRERQRLYECRLKKKYLIGKSCKRRIYELYGKYESIDDVVDFKNMVKSWNEACVLPETMRVRREWIIMKRPDEIDNFSNVTYLPNDAGKIVKVQIHSRKWELVERIPHYVDRTFALLGDNRKIPMRHSFDEACGIFIDTRLSEGEVPLVIHRMKNKIVFSYEREPIKALVCFNITEAKQFCYYLHLRYKDNSNVLIFNNITNGKRDELIDELARVTGVDRAKVAQCRSKCI